MGYRNRVTITVRKTKNKKIRDPNRQRPPNIMR
jgi:hypothetical protein